MKTSLDYVSLKVVADTNKTHRKDAIVNLWELDLEDGRWWSEIYLVSYQLVFKELITKILDALEQDKTDKFEEIQSFIATLSRVTFDTDETLIQYLKTTDITNKTIETLHKEIETLQHQPKVDG